MKKEPKDKIKKDKKKKIKKIATKGTHISVVVNSHNRKSTAPRRSNPRATASGTPNIITTTVTPQSTPQYVEHVPRYYQPHTLVEPQQSAYPISIPQPTPAMFRQQTDEHIHIPSGNKSVISTIQPVNDQLDSTLFDSALHNYEDENVHKRTPAKATRLPPKHTRSYNKRDPTHWEKIERRKEEKIRKELEEIERRKQEREKTRKEKDFKYIMQHDDDDLSL